MKKRKRKRSSKNHNKPNLSKKRMQKKAKNNASKKIMQKNENNKLNTNIEKEDIYISDDNINKELKSLDNLINVKENANMQEQEKRETKQNTAVLLKERPVKTEKGEEKEKESERVEIAEEKKSKQKKKTEKLNQKEKVKKNKEKKTKKIEEQNKEKEKNKKDQNAEKKSDEWKKVEKNEKHRIDKKQRKEARLQLKEERKAKREERRKKHKILKFILKFFLIIVILSILLLIVGMWGFAGLLLGWYGNEDIQIRKEDLEIKVSNSVIVDQNGNVLADLSGDEKRKIITLEEMADNLPKAYIAIEDERYYEHSGVDFKRTAGAIINTLFNGESSYGGSTITQQLVKNITNDNESTGIEGIKRKIREWQRAYQVERMISKEQILELYLNILFVGANNLHGVELGAEYYFNKSAKDLSLAECAFMAGINHSPNSYNPYNTSIDNSEKIKNRTITVLDKMKELEYISKEEYTNAVTEVENGLQFGTGNIMGGSVFSYHTDAVISQVIKQVMEEKNMTEQMAKNYVYSSGLTIHSTVDMNIQNRLEEEYTKEKYMIRGREKNSDGTLLNEHSESGMAIVDYKTGNVVAVAGGFGEKTSAGWNRATQMEKQTGSSIKPLADVAPALQEKIITAATVYDDSSTRFGKNYEPKNYNGFKGWINIRSFIRTSQNIPAVKIMAELTPKKSLEYLQKMGITSLDTTTDNVLSLALGGMTSGVSPLEMASAYGTIANDGVYITPTFYTNVTDANGNVVLTPKQETRQVISKQNAYIMKTIIQEPVKSGGTATYCAIPGMEVAAKTGTTDNDYDRWLCGFTPYYAAATWYGYDNSETVYFSGNPAGQIWSAVMKDIHKDLPSVTFIIPEGIVERTVCKTTGCLASKSCTNTYTEIFTEDNLPEQCTNHKRLPKESLGVWTPLKKNK